MTAKPSEQLSTTAEVAARWRVTPREVQRMCANGEVAHVRIGSRIRISSAAVAAYERSHSRPGRTDR